MTIVYRYHGHVVDSGHFFRLHYKLQARLPMWVIYRQNTADYPGKWVARMHLTLPENATSRAVITADSLEEIRAALPAGLTCLARDPKDDPVIEETWL